MFSYHSIKFEIQVEQVAWGCKRSCAGLLLLDVHALGRSRFQYRFIAGHYTGKLKGPDRLGTRRWSNTSIKVQLRRRIQWVRGWGVQIQVPARFFFCKISVKHITYKILCLQLMRVRDVLSDNAHLQVKYVT